MQQKLGAQSTYALSGLGDSSKIPPERSSQPPTTIKGRPTPIRDYLNKLGVNLQFPASQDHFLPF